MLFVCLFCCCCFFFVALSRLHYTIVQTVLRLGSNRTALPSTDLALVLYMGFSKAACPLLFSWTEQPVYWVLGVVLRKRKEKNNTKKAWITQRKTELLLSKVCVCVCVRKHCCDSWLETLTAVYRDRIQSLQISGRKKAQGLLWPQSYCLYQWVDGTSYYSPTCSDL